MLMRYYFSFILHFDSRSGCERSSLSRASEPALAMLQTYDSAKSFPSYAQETLAKILSGPWKSSPWHENPSFLH